MQGEVLLLEGLIPARVNHFAKSNACLASLLLLRTTCHEVCLCLQCCAMRRDSKSIGLTVRGAGNSDVLFDELWHKLIIQCSYVLCLLMLALYPSSASE